MLLYLSHIVRRLLILIFIDQFTDSAVLI